MEGVTDAPMREFMGELGAFSYCVSEFIRVSGTALDAKAFLRHVPELSTGARTGSGLPVQVQILGGDPDRMARSAMAAVEAGATAIDVNFGCPAKTVNRNDGGASLLRHPERIQEIVARIRAAVPKAIPVSAKLRLGWESIDDVHENARRAVLGGASWITLHARTRMQGYTPPVFWPHVGEVRCAVPVPVVANGDIWSLDDFRRCQAETGCIHFMIGRGALANPALPGQIAAELGLVLKPSAPDWLGCFERFVTISRAQGLEHEKHLVMRLKQWMKLAHNHGDFPAFDRLKLAATVEEILDRLDRGTSDCRPDPQTRVAAP